MICTKIKKVRLLLPALGLIGGIILLISVNVTPGRAGSGHEKGYSPGLGDFMNSAMEVHHLKLWLSGHADNWRLAAYEAKELRETVEDIRTYAPKWHDLPIGEMIKILGPALDRVEQAVSAKNSVKFDAAYDKLTASCNACHSAAGMAEIRIRKPSPQGGGPFPDQMFATGR